MSREIKFRAWEKVDEKMHPFDIYTMLDNDEGWCHVEDGYGGFGINLKEGDMPIMQYTGLKDKNGVEIYEGDIVKSVTGKLYPVSWHKTGWSMIEGTWISHCKVIGNIYENPELLAEKKPESSDG